MAAQKPPILYVEGKDDVSAISNLLKRHGLDTKRGCEHLLIKDLESVETVLSNMVNAIRASTDRAVGFVIDIDVAIESRWNLLRSKLKSIGIETPERCPREGYFAKLDGYRFNFGVWLMPDCELSEGKLEHLIQTLVPANDAMWPLAQRCVSQAAEVADRESCPRFREVDRIKAEVHTWLAWSPIPGAAFGAAINSRVLGSDSPQAHALLRWIKNLFGFEQLVVPD